MSFDQNESNFSFRNFLYDHHDLPDHLIHFLIKQKTRTPICTAIVSLDLKTFYFTSKANVELHVDANNRKSETPHPDHFEIIKAKLSFLPGVTINVEALSIPFCNNLRFCLFFQDETPVSDQLEKSTSPGSFNDFLMAFMNLTDREKQVARMVALGRTSVQLAKELNIAKNTVKNHRKNIRRKLKITTKAEQIEVDEWLRNFLLK